MLSEQMVLAVGRRGTVVMVGWDTRSNPRPSPSLLYALVSPPETPVCLLDWREANEGTV